MKYLGIVGSICMGLSPFFNWESLLIDCDIDHTKMGVSLYDLAKADKVNGTHFMIIVYAMIAVAAILLVLQLVDIVPFLDFKFGKNKKRHYAFCIAIAVAIVLWLVAFNSKTINDSVRWYKELADNYKAVYADFKGHGNKGLGPVIFIAGLIANVPNTIKSAKIVAKDIKR